ncbi:MAG TPA: class I SAM-dependent methyltransferase [Burkholderiaceae bacterium]|nr:class I SAM-dependent methyltransferase [Burkholderiaceae bacterium]
MTRPAPDPANTPQVELWNGAAGRKWVDRQPEQDVVLAPVSAALFARAAAAPGERVVDVGCGCGGTTFALGRRVGPAGHVLGVDVSAAMLERARELAPAGLPVDLVLADATVHEFDAGAADLLFSRFGVMFFADPARSFANLRRALRPGGRACFACWREARANPWLMVPLQAAYRHVPRLPEVGPDDPGPFSFAREDRVRRVLEAAGFVAIELEQVDLRLDVAAGGGLDNAVQTALRIGPASRALDGQPPDAIVAATASIRAALEPYVDGARVVLAGSTWIVTALNPGPATPGS